MRRVEKNEKTKMVSLHSSATQMVSSTYHYTISVATQSDLMANDLVRFGTELAEVHVSKVYPTKHNVMGNEKTL